MDIRRGIVLAFLNYMINIMFTICSFIGMLTVWFFISKYLENRKKDR